MIMREDSSKSIGGERRGRADLMQQQEQMAGANN